MTRNEAIEELRDMWTWLYSHPAHDRKYYMKHVAKIDPAWTKECPLSHAFEGRCDQCLSLYDNGNGTLCEDQNSPMNKWRNTHPGDPNFKTWYAGKMIEIARKALR